MSGPVNPNVHKCALCPFSAKFPSGLKAHSNNHSDAKPFKCPECPFTTKTKKTIKRHLTGVHFLQTPSSRPFPCSHPGCNFRAKDKSNLSSHLKTHLVEKSLVCAHPNCNYSTNFKTSLTYHTRIHTGEKPFVCKFESCSFAATQSNDLASHTRTHTKEKPYKCLEPSCKFSTSHRGNLKTHRLTHEPKDGEERPLFKCPLCEYSGKSKHNLSKHIKSHTLEKWFKCDDPNCNFEAKKTSDFKRHKLVHSDEKPFVCPFESCEYRCKFNQSLSSHMKSHSTERRYKCELCPFRGKTQGVVRNHLKYVHVDPEFGPFKCTEPNCELVFKNKAGLQRHFLLHSREKNYKCSFADCKYRATAKGTLKSHEYNIHSEEKKEKCLICNYTCKSRSILTIHMRTHTKEKPYFCKEKANGCEYQATTSSTVRRHEKKHNSVLNCKISK